ncbi:MAG: DUF4331 domain-containing protein [Gemmatimonadetes bacterium]|nr:DUF4331 domain-containing protein [Gemmatimonadota bacterium]
MRKVRKVLQRSIAPLVLAMLVTTVFASSHLDAPMITEDDPANTTDVYAFTSREGGVKYLTTALAVYPFEEPGNGPNKYNFDDDVLYEIHVATGSDVAAGRPTFSYQFDFNTTYKNTGTILQSYKGVVQNVRDEGQNLVQFFGLNRVNHRAGTSIDMGGGFVPPNNQGVVTPKYNRGDNGENAAKEGVSSRVNLDTYTRQTIFELRNGHEVFAGQRDDGFYADIQGVFDLLNFSGPNKPFDSQGGFNVHTIVLNIPVSELGGDQQVVGVWATTSRRRTSVLRDANDATDAPALSGAFVQVGRQGNPLFNEGLVAIRDKDRYSRTNPSQDRELFEQYALRPELAKLINLVFAPSPAAPETNRTDIAGIFIPDVIKTDLSTPPVRLAGNPNDPGFNRLGIFGGDVVRSQVQDPFGNGGFIPGGWPNGRRFGDDVFDIVVCALLSDLRTSPPQVRCDASANIDRVVRNDITYNKVLPYAATPLNGRNHPHH